MKIKKEKGTRDTPRVEGYGVTKDNPLGLKYIYRILADWPGRNYEPIGWRVHFHSTLKIEPSDLSFYDDHHGGKQRTLQKAIKWRDAQMKKHKIVMTPRRLARPQFTRSPIGIRGVYRVTGRNLYLTTFSEVPDKHIMVHIPWGPRIGSQRDALLTAVWHRVQAEKRIYGRVMNKLPKSLERELKTFSKSRLIPPASKYGPRNFLKGGPLAHRLEDAKALKGYYQRGRYKKGAKGRGLGIRPVYVKDEVKDKLLG